LYRKLADECLQKPCCERKAKMPTNLSPGNKNRSSMLARSAWFRLMLVLPVCLLFWLGVWWALAGTAG